MIDPFHLKASDQPSHLFFGPEFMKSFGQFPDETRYIYQTL